jgi:hypothetical protein
LCRLGRILFFLHAKFDTCRQVAAVDSVHEKINSLADRTLVEGRNKSAFTDALHN